MKKFVFFILSIWMSLLLAACGSSPNTPDNKVVNTSVSTAESAEGQGKKILIAYFSRSGTTENVANLIRQQVGGDMFKIETVKEYPTAYREATEVAKAERENNERPAIKQPLPDLKDYDVIFVGYPIWWHTAPMAVFTFLESYDLSGKTIIPFCTSGGSSIEESMAGMRQLAASATLLEGLTGNRPADIESWLVKIGLKK